MTKRDLDSLRILNEKIRRKQERIDLLRSKALPGAIRYKPDKLSTPTVFDPMGDIIAEVWDEERKLDSLIDLYYDIRQMVCAEIRTQTDEQTAAILCQRYIHEKSWNDIQDRVKCTQRTMFRKHTQGVRRMLSTTRC